MKNRKFTIIVTTLLILISSGILFAQTEIGIGSDFVSRYVWRGLDFGDSPSIQPSITLNNGALELGIWGAYQVGRDATSLPADEIDLYLEYSFAIGNNSLSFIVTDYYFPNGEFKIGDFDGDGNGAHTIEAGATFTLSESLPLYLSGYVNIHNDPDYSSYFELGYSTLVKNILLDVFIGATPGGVNGYYKTDNFSITNVGIKATKEIKINDDFSLPIFALFAINPNQDIAHFVFGISI